MILLASFPGRVDAQSPEGPADPAEDPGGTSTYLLDVRVNGWSLGLVARFVQEGQRLRLPAEQFDGLGFLADEAAVTTLGNQRWVYLDQVPGLSWTIDQRAQTIDIIAPFALRKVNDLSIAPPQRRIEARADWGAMFAYDVFGQWSVKENDTYFTRQLSTNLDARLFAPWFTFASTGVFTIGQGTDTRFTRLETALDFDNPERSWRFRIGDSYTGGPIWVRPVRFGGVQWGRDFSLRPDIVTVPVAAIEQDVAVPSTVDIFVNGVQRYSQAVDPGRVLLNDLPVAAGTNAIRAVITDTTGRRIEVILPFYATTERLAKGVTNFSVELGFPREDYAVASNHYGPAFASGLYSKGVTDRATLHGYAAASKDYLGATAGATFALGTLAEIEGALLYSNFADRNGWGFYTGISRTTPRFSLAASYYRGNQHYFDLASFSGYSRYRKRVTGSGSINLGRLGQVNLTYIYQKTDLNRITSVATGNWAFDLDRRGHVHVTGSGYTDTETGDWGASVSLTVQLGNSVKAYGLQSWDRQGRIGQLQLQGYGFNDRLDWELDGVNAPDGNYALGARANWDGAKADLYARASRINDSTGFEVQVAQSLVLMDDRLFVAGRIDDGFTVVEVENSPGIDVALENRFVGRTGKSGTVLLTDLQSYVPNAISIDPLDLPLDAEVRDTSQLVSPRGGSGMVTRFAVSRERSAIVLLRAPDGQPPPVGAIVKLSPGGGSAVLGFGGEVYLRGLAPGSNRIDVSWEGGVCSATFPAEVVAGTLPRLGPFTCAP